MSGDEEEDRRRRWRLVLGGEGGDLGVELEGEDLVRDRALTELYDADARGPGSLARSAPSVARWLGDIRSHFPSKVVQVMQADAMDRLGLQRLLTEPETLASVEPDVNLVATLMGLRGAIPDSSREAARQVVRTVTDQLQERLGRQLAQAVNGALDRARRTSRPRPGDIDWGRTIAANLRHWLPEERTVVPERLVGHARRRSQLERHVVLCIDQSGSMASSIVWSGVFGAVLASLRSVRTTLVVFDTEVVDLTDELDDPVDVLFGVQLGGGTDINRALAYCQTLVERPEETVLVLLSDLLEGGIAEEMLRRVRQLHDSGVVVVVLLALSDDGAPYYDREHAQALAALGVPAFACTPDVFPDLMAAAIGRQDLARWAAEHDIVTAGHAEPE
ncbi:VWA domain-containing protein [Auraticoccus sp. F435]|uniref:VWA domain-containing protein n=1 Tax=Auraticoccus cholistanensis TaxID=2656650 RepID=A0A6A9UQ06_9ACTN|nr:VWA domain-containing protein [Auraticoccus cholistanensis]MVA74628.1 VWA domain-containing protein [Auraticoccus cholistanensis]